MNTKASHQPVAYLFFALFFIQMLFVVCGISRFDSGETFLSVIFLLEGLYAWSQTSRLTSDSIVITFGIKRKEIPFNTIASLTYHEHLFVLNLKDGTAIQATPSPQLIATLKQVGISIPKLPLNQSFCIRHTMLNIFATIQGLLLCFIWQKLALNTGHSSISLLLFVPLCFMLMLVIGSLSNKITYNNQLLKVKGILRVRQRVSLQTIEHIDIKNVAGCSIYCAYCGKKRIFRSVSLPFIGLLCALAETQGATISYSDYNMKESHSSK